MKICTKLTNEVFKLSKKTEGEKYLENTSWPETDLYIEESMEFKSS